MWKWQEEVLMSIIDSLNFKLKIVHSKEVKSGDIREFLVSKLQRKYLEDVNLRRSLLIKKTMFSGEMAELVE